jgi:hypothetical protein
VDVLAVEAVADRGEFFVLAGAEEGLLGAFVDEGEQGRGGVRISPLDWQGRWQKPIGFFPGLLVHTYIFIIRQPNGTIISTFHTSIAYHLIHQCRSKAISQGLIHDLSGKDSLSIVDD